MCVRIKSDSILADPGLQGYMVHWVGRAHAGCQPHRPFVQLQSAFLKVYQFKCQSHPKHPPGKHLKLIIRFSNSFLPPNQVFTFVGCHKLLCNSWLHIIYLNLHNGCISEANDIDVCSLLLQSLAIMVSVF